MGSIPHSTAAGAGSLSAEGGSPNAILECAGLTHAYDGLSVVEDMSISLRSGRSIGIMAPVGAGKSTFLRLLLGLERANSGVVNMHVPAASVGVAFHDHNLLPWLSVRDNVELLGVLQGRKPPSSRIEELLSAFGLRSVAQSYPAALSAGMRQKATIARLLAARPRLLVLDEALANMDELTRFEVCDILDSEVSTQGASMLVVTHNPSDALQLCDEIIVSRGRPLRPFRVFGNPLSRPRRSKVRFSSIFGAAMESIRLCMTND